MISHDVHAIMYGTGVIHIIKSYTAYGVCGVRDHEKRIN